LVALGAVASASTLLLLWLGARQFLSYDGVWHVFIARQESWGSFWREVLENAHPPLYYSLLGVAIRFLGKSFLAYRAISIAAVVLSSLLIARIVAVLTSSPKLGVVAAAAFGLSFNAAEVGLEVRAYALCVFFLLAAFSIYLEWLNTSPARFPHWKRAALGGALTAAILSNYSALIFLAAALGVPALLFLSHRRWRIRLFREVGQHYFALALMFLPPLIATWVMYRIQVRHWAGRLNHIPGFMWDAHRESAWDFIAHVSRSLALLALPALGPEGRVTVGIVAVCMLGGVLLVAQSSVRRRLAIVPLVLLGLMLVLNLVAGLKGRYPIGGELRHEFFLFPFSTIALFTGIDAVRRALPRSFAWSRSWTVATAFAVAASTGFWMSSFRVEPRALMQLQMDAFRSAVGQPAAVLVDQFSFIMFYLHHHEWDWHLAWEDPRRDLWQVWELSRSGQSFKVCRVRDWQLDLSNPATYSDVAECMRHAPQVAVFRPQQPDFTPGWDLKETPRLSSTLGAAVGVVPTTVSVAGADLYLAFRPGGIERAVQRISNLEATYGGNCGAPPGNATAAVELECHGVSPCFFRVRVEAIGDPAPGCAKDFVAAWSCVGEGPRRQAFIPAEASYGSAALLECGP
jgi:hypothetical protein